MFVTGSGGSTTLPFRAYQVRTDFLPGFPGQAA